MPLLFRRLHDALDRNTAAFERHAEAFDDFRDAFRQDRLRSERMFSELLSAVGEMREDIRTHTKAIESLLDRFGEGPTPAS